MPPTATKTTPPERPPDVVSAVRVGDLIPSLDNKRGKTDGKALKALACSIGSVGIIQPLVARQSERFLLFWKELIFYQPVFSNNKYN